MEETRKAQEGDAEQHRSKQGQGGHQKDQQQKTSNNYEAQKAKEQSQK